MRCIACDGKLKDEEVYWDEEKGKHEDMCFVCRGKAFDVHVEDDVIPDVLHVPERRDEWD